MATEIFLVRPATTLLWEAQMVWLFLSEKVRWVLEPTANRDLPEETFHEPFNKDRRRGRARRGGRTVDNSRRQDIHAGLHMPRDHLVVCPRDRACGIEDFLVE